MKKLIKRIKSWVDYNLRFLKVLNSPFKGLFLTFYFGEIAKGTPYFLPRKWIELTQKECEEALAEDIERCSPIYMKDKTWEHYKRYTKPVPIKYFHWHFTTLGWKTKWESYRFEWSPSLSIVIFGKQLFITILPNMRKDIMFNKEFIKMDCYWESWLHWEYDTNKSLPLEERLRELISKHSNGWGSPKEGYTDYYLYILKEKHLPLYNKLKNG